MTIDVLAWSLDFGSSQLAGILIGAGVILAGIWWWEKRRFRLPEIKVWDAAVTRGFLEEHRYMDGFYERRLDALIRLVERLPPNRREKLLTVVDGIKDRLEDYRDAIGENEELESITPADRWTIVSRQDALEEPLRELAFRVNQWYREHSRHEKLKARTQEINTVLARASSIRDYFQWRRMLVYLAERSQTIPPRQMVSFRLAERGSALHQRLEGFFRMIRTPGVGNRAVRRAHRMFRKKLLRFARSVMEAQVVGGEKTLILQDAQKVNGVVPVKGVVNAEGVGGRHDPLAHLQRKKRPAGEVALTEDGLASMTELWKRFEHVAAPGLSHYEGYLNFVVCDEEIPGASHPELESALKKSMRIRVLDKITDEWEKVEFEVHFGRYLVFKADWLARARELEIRMSNRQREKAKCFSLHTVEHRAVSILPKNPGE